MDGADGEDGDGQRGPYPGGGDHDLSDSVEPPPFALICAWLESECDYRRHEILNLSRFYVRRVLGWPRNEDGKLKPPPRADGQPLSRADVLRRLYFLRGWPAHRIEDRVAESLRAEQESRRKAKTKPAPARRGRAARLPRSELLRDGE